MLAACDRKVVGRFAAAADGLLGIVDERAGIERRVGRDSRDECDPGPAGERTSQHHCMHAFLITDRHGEITKTVALQIVDAGDDDTVDGLRRQLRRLTDCDLLLDLREFVLERGDLRHSRFGHLQELVLVLDAELLGRLRNRLLGLTGEFEAGGAGKRLDPANVRTDRPLADDPELANVAQRPNMRAAAQFDRVAARLQHPYNIAVLVAEESDCTELLERLLAVNTNFDRADLLEALRNPSLVSSYADPTVPTDLRLEGTLFPATYDVAEEDVADEARFLQRMADTFDQRYENLLGEVGRDPAILELGLSDYDVIVVASMIEREARVDVDRPLMARAIYNRLAQGMPLQIDATVYYAAGKSFTETLFQSDLDAESPWNTYTTPGIPPTPIAAPGEAAMRAALDPADGEMIFWARTDENGIVGAHAFSASLDEHNEAVARCRELGYCG